METFTWVIKIIFPIFDVKFMLLVSTITEDEMQKIPLDNSNTPCDTILELLRPKNVQTQRQIKPRKKSCSTTSETWMKQHHKKDKKKCILNVQERKRKQADKKFVKVESKGMTKKKIKLSNCEK